MHTVLLDFSIGERKPNTEIQCVRGSFCVCMIELICPIASNDAEIVMFCKLQLSLLSGNSNYKIATKLQKVTYLFVLFFVVLFWGKTFRLCILGK